MEKRKLIKGQEGPGYPRYPCRGGNSKIFRSPKQGQGKSAPGRDGRDVVAGQPALRPGVAGRKG